MFRDSSGRVYHTYMSHTLLYGGTFDPIHLGHLITCQRARELLAADQVFFIPARVSPHKTHLESSSAEHRLAMLRLAIASNPLFAADDRELSRTGPSYTFDTLTSLKTDFPQKQFTLLIGADQLPKLHTWHRIHELLAMNPVAILSRTTAEALGDVFDHITPHFSEAMLDRLKSAILKTPQIDISATEIRARVTAGLPIDYLVPPPVAAYIATHQLYRPIKA